MPRTDLRRIAIVCPNWHPRTCGVGDYSMRLGAELQRRGLEVQVFSRAPAEPNPEAPGLPAFGAEAPTASLIALQLSRELGRYRPDLVLLQYTPQALGASARGSAAMVMVGAQARRLGARLLVVAHEPYTPWAKRPDLLLGNLAHRAQFTALAALSQRLVVTTESRLALVRQFLLGVVPADRFAMVPVGSGASPVRALPAPPGRFRLGLFSTLSKRFDVLLEAFRLIRDQAPEAELLLVGDLGAPGTPGHDRLRAQLEAHPHRAAIQLTGKLPLREVARAVAGLDVFLFPMDSGANTRSSTLPLALGAGVPVVAIQGFETSPWFRDGENLLFARALSAPAFAEAALRLRQEPALAARVAEGGLRLFAERLSWPTIVDQMLGALEG